MTLAPAAQANNDARSALGIRPGARPTPRVYIEEPIFEDIPPSPKADYAPPSPTNRHISIAIPSGPSHAQTSPGPSTGSEPNRRFRRPTLSRKLQPANLTSNRGLYEMQKLLAHLIERLETRDPAPNILDRAAIAAREANGRPRTKSKMSKLGQVVAAATSTASPPRAGISSEDMEDKVLLDEGEWDTEETVDLVEQMRGLLVLAEKQGLDLFGSTISTEETPSPVRNKRKAGRFSSIASPLKGESEPEPPAVSTGAPLLNHLTALLRSLLLIDGIHRVHLFRPLRPPFALQVACLDIAAYLYQKCSIETKLDMLEIVTDAIYVMSDIMAERICEWLEGRLGELLTRLARDRGREDGDDLEWNDPFARPANLDIPTFAFSADPEPDEPKSGWMRYSPTAATGPFPTPFISGILSTHTVSGQFASATLRIASLVPRILIAVSSTIDLVSAKLTTIHRVHRLLALLLTAKTDAPLDLLEIIAHAPPIPRKRALSVLATFYSDVTGHNTIARRPALATYETLRYKWESGQERVLGEDDTEAHNYIPWRATEESRCAVCDAFLQGFCVRCTLCDDIRHLHCHQPPSDQVFIYDVVVLGTSESTPYTVYVKFSKCHRRLDEKVLGSSIWGNDQSVRRRSGQHDLHLVNLFNVTLCAACSLPCWGATQQAYACTSGCQSFFHPQCVDLDERPCRFRREVFIDNVSRDPFSISSTNLKSSFEAYQPQSEADAAKLSYDEMAIRYSNTWIQYQLLKNGLGSGSIRTDGRRSDSDVLGLRRVLKQNEERLRTLAASSAIMDFSHVTQTTLDHIMFTPRYLAYCTALLRAPATMTTTLPSQGLLTVDSTASSPSQEATHVSYETVPMTHIRHSLSTDMNIKDDLAAALFLEQLRTLGLCALPKKRSITSDTMREDTELHFYAPLLMDSSSTVELLILAIESLLTDLDLSSNEHGFALLSNRAWPSLLCSPYALERLGNAVMAWVMGEDNAIHQIVKEYASKRKRIPGVRSEAGANKGAATVGMYKDDRRRMMMRYAQPWLAALHEQDHELYAHVAYEQCKAPLGWDVGDVAAEEAAAQVAGAALERMAALGDAGVVFSVLMDLLTAWLEDLGGLSDKDVVYKSLPRLLARPEIAGHDRPDLWTLANETSRDGPEEFRSVCRWMRVLAFSGVDIPWENLTALLDLQTTTRSSVDAKLDLTIAIGANSTPIEAEAFAQLASQALASFTESLERKSTISPPSTIELDVLRQSLLLVLRAYAVPQDEIALSHLNRGEGVSVKQPPSLAKKRRVTELRPKLIPLDPGMVVAAASVLRMPNYPMEMMLDFFWLLITKAPAVDNVGGFLHHMCSTLYEVIWLLYDRPVDRQCRTRVFLKLLTINTLPIEKLVSEQLDALDRARIQERLLTIIIELADDSVTFEVKGWQSPAIGLILLFFDSLLDPTDVSPDNIVILRSLLPSHLTAIARCFEAYLVQSSDERRLVLLSRLQRLRFSVPSWPVITWKALEELLVEQVANIAHLRKSDSQQARDALRDAEAVRANLLALGLDMLASGIEIDWMSMHRFQQHVASACTIPWPAHQISNLTTLVLPALRQVLDTTAKVPVGFTGSEKKKTAIAGSLFVSIAVDFSSELQRHDFIAERCILDILMVMFFKQNVQAVELSALSTLQTLADFADVAGCVENRLLAIHVLQTALSKMQKESSARVVPSIFCAVAKILDTEANDGDPSIAEQCKVYLRSAIATFGRSGLFLQLFRADTASTPVLVGQKTGSLGRALQMLVAEEPREAPPKPSLTEMVFGDLLDLFKRGKQTCQQVINSLYTFVDALDAELSDEAAQSFGAFVTRFGKHVGEWSAEDFDPNPLLRACSKVLDLVPATQCVTLLHQTSTFLHLALNHFNVQHETVVALSASASKVVVREKTEDTVATVMSEIAGAAVNGSSVTPTTLYTLLTFLIEPSLRKASPQRLRVLVEASAGCLPVLLRTHQAMSLHSDPELLINLLTSAGTVIVRAEEGVNGNISRVLANITNEAVQVQISVFMYILLASLDVHLGPSREGLLALYPLVARATSLCIRAASDYLTLQDPAGEGAELLSTSFAIVRLAIMAVHALEPGNDEWAYGSATANGIGGEREAEEWDDLYGDEMGNEMLVSFWDRVWPDWSRLLSLSLDPSCINGPLRAVSHSILLDLILFLSIARPTVLVSHARELGSALAVLAHWHESAGTQPGPKWVKASTAVTRAPTALESGAKVGSKEVRGAVKAVRTDLVAMERLRALRTSL